MGKKVCIIGSGISGLSIGQLLKKNNSIDILEKEPQIGGIARTKQIGNIAYHTVGGHCFNSKNIEVMKFVFDKIMNKNQWHKIKRTAKIYYKNHFIDYPIEYSIKDIALFDQDMAYAMTRDFFNAEVNEESPPINLDIWFRQHFGNALSDEYFIPYNKKIWGMEPSEMSPDWVKGKLPIPSKKDFFKALLTENTDLMPHAHFYYPTSNTQNTFIDSLGRDLNIILNCPVEKIEKSKNGWVVNGEKQYDVIISTMPLNLLPFIIDSAPEKIKNAARLLKYNKVSNVIWECEPNNSTWLYFPEQQTPFHRHILIGNFNLPSQNYSITEIIGEKPFEDIVREGKKIDYLKKPIDYNVSDHAYVVFDKHYKESKQIIMDYLSQIGIHTLGRFGEWEYYNMDICIESAMKLAGNNTFFKE